MSDQLKKCEDTLGKIPYRKIIKQIQNIKVAIDLLDGKLGPSDISDEEELSEGEGAAKEKKIKSESDDDRPQSGLIKQPSFTKSSDTHSAQESEPDEFEALQGEVKKLQGEMTEL